MDQGYTFRTVTALEGFRSEDARVFRSKAEQRELLATVLLASEEDLESEESEDADEAASDKRRVCTRGSAEGVVSAERGRAERHLLFRKMDKRHKK